MKEWKILTAKRRALLMDIIDTHEEYRGCYMWTARQTSANERRRREFAIKLQFIWKGQEYDVAQSLDISCRNFYFSSTVTVDDDKKDIRALKRLVGVK